MVKKADINNHQMLDIIRSVVKDRNIPDDQQHMVEKKTNGHENPKNNNGNFIVMRDEGPPSRYHITSARSHVS